MLHIKLYKEYVLTVYILSTHTNTNLIHIYKYMYIQICNFIYWRLASGIILNCIQFVAAYNLHVFRI